MKNVNYLINGGLAAAVVALFVMQFSNKKASDNTTPASTTPVAAEVVLPIAYIDVDSLLKNYNLAHDISETLIRKQETSRANLNEKARQLEAEMKEFQRKIENNAFLSRERAEAEQNRLMRKQQELQELDQRLSVDFMNEQQKMNQQIRDSINNYINQYNAAKKFHMIISNTNNDNLLYADKAYDITKEIVSGLNTRYTKK
ncbi:MAG: OmpH family outer membrane protein [Bacteroidales bacterium]